jgi:hypothetical protein
MLNISRIRFPDRCLLRCSLTLRLILPKSEKPKLRAVEHAVPTGRHFSRRICVLRTEISLLIPC